MKRGLLPLFFLLLSAYISAQTVENIRVEQDGDKLNIHYRIGGSSSEQLYYVSLSCTIDNGPLFEPKALIGDVGANIRGGKSFNTIVWDVYEDVEEIGSVEFFVKVDLEGNEGPVERMQTELREMPADPLNTNTQKYRTRFVGFDGSSVMPLGLRGGVLNNWGAYGAARMGYDLYLVPVGAITGGVTKRVLNRESFRLHAYTGLGIGGYFDSAEFELGLIAVIKDRVNLNLGLVNNYWYIDGSFGIGIVF